MSKGGCIRVEQRGRLILAHFPEEPTLDGTREFFKKMEGTLQRRERIGLVLEALQVRTSPLAVREESARFLIANKNALRALLACQATVLSSPLIRGSLAAMHFIAPPGYPTKTFGELGKAVAWAEGILGRAMEQRP